MLSWATTSSSTPAHVPCTHACVVSAAASPHAEPPLLSTILSRLSSRLEELDRIPVGIFHLDLSAARTSLHLIAKLHPSVLERVDLRRKISHAKDHSIPSARLLGLTA